MKSNLIFTCILILSVLGVNLEVTGQPKSESDIETIIDGRMWVPKATASFEEQFFLKQMKLSGSFLYNGIKFDNLEFAYDLVNEEILTAVETIEGHKSIIIVNPYSLEGFNVNNDSDTFNFLRGDLLHEELDPHLYYQVIKTSSLKYIIKRTKYLKAKSVNSLSGRCFSENSLFMIKKGELIPIKSKKDILNIFPNQKKELNRFIHDNKLKIGTERPWDTVLLIMKFDQ